MLWGKNISNVWRLISWVIENIKHKILSELYVFIFPLILTEVIEDINRYKHI